MVKTNQNESGQQKRQLQDNIKSHKHQRRSLMELSMTAMILVNESHRGVQIVAIHPTSVGIRNTGVVNVGDGSHKGRGAMGMAGTDARATMGWSKWEDG